MGFLRSRLGRIVALAYLAVCAILIGWQGIFGESFIALILGLPWTLALAAFEFFNAVPPLAYVLIFLPIVINMLLLCWIGSLFDKRHVR